MLRDDRPDPVRVRQALAVLDPALAGEALDPADFVASSGMPSPAWLARASELRVRTLGLPTEAALPDDALVAATGLAPDLGQRLIRRRAFLRRLCRAPLFPAPAASSAFLEDGRWLVLDTVLDDGRWARLRTRALALPSSAPHAWLDRPLAEVESWVGAPVRRCVVGPAWRDASGQVRGLAAVVEATGEALVRRLALDRELASEASVDALVVPVALPP